MTLPPKYQYVDYDALPTHMRQGAEDYIERGDQPGGFLFAVFVNDLVEAFARADEINAAAMPAWAEWLYNEAPSACWGSVEKVRAWQEQRRASHE